jgi:hypothetical protein
MRAWWLKTTKKAQPAELGGWVRAGLSINENMPDEGESPTLPLNACNPVFSGQDS